ncbi:hypothetical protein [Chryseolinea sp. H1M3-3]|uniref:hypothetical protein n=1 Tax=Chryseolinea sp. H1M3-3 TaxID=3034144 RepID=UPI0023EBBCE9|nr:hypothetical protein [Chryseolinea sp. H1M3-3]
MNRKFSIKDLPKIPKGNHEMNCYAEMTVRLAFTDALYLDLIDKPVTKLVSEEVKRHCIVSYVSVIEVFCKRLVVKYHTKWSTAGYNKLLDANISLNEAYNLFKELKISRASIISHYYSFQNLSAIASIFERLTNKKILDEIENIRENKNDFTLLETSSEWRTELAKLFELRHRIIHETSWNLNLKDVDVERLSLITGSFCSALYMYCGRTKTFN